MSRPTGEGRRNWPHSPRLRHALVPLAQVVVDAFPLDARALLRTTNAERTSGHARRHTLHSLPSPRMLQIYRRTSSENWEDTAAHRAQHEHHDDRNHSHRFGRLRGRPRLLPEADSACRHVDTRTDQSRLHRERLIDDEAVGASSSGLVFQRGNRVLD